MTWGAVCWHRKFSVPLLRISVLVFSSLWLTDTDASMAVEGRTWKYLHELSDEERRNIDPRADTPRDATLPYLPAEPYPFTPPYTAEEMGLRAMEFPHIARWNFAMIEDFGSVTPTGYLATAKTLVLSVYPEPEGLVAISMPNPARCTPAGCRKTPIHRRTWATSCS